MSQEFWATMSAQIRMIYSVREWNPSQSTQDHPFILTGVILLLHYIFFTSQYFYRGKMKFKWAWKAARVPNEN